MTDSYVAEQGLRKIADAIQIHARAEQAKAEVLRDFFNRIATSVERVVAIIEKEHADDR